MAAAPSEKGAESSRGRWAAPLKVCDGPACLAAPASCGQSLVVQARPGRHTGDGGALLLHACTAGL
eukprot:6293143-Alexandrium_andersonii.AAC.1